ncbi:MAG: DUF4179 domain-containing protein [Lachnospiraceae bacterium]|nr:DUF4179 domain-containing protein [Lachnospiraceae bacterium]
MKDNNNYYDNLDPGEVLDTLCSDIEIPKGVQKKAEEAFSKIHASCENRNDAERDTQESKHRTSDSGYHAAAIRQSSRGQTSLKFTRRRSWIMGVAAAAIMLFGIGAAAAYRQWSKSIEQGMQADEEQLAMLESEEYLVTSGQSVTTGGVTITAKECIADKNFAYLVFKVEGYTPEDNVQPEFEFADVTAADGSDLYGENATGSASRGFFNGLVINNEGQAVYADGSGIAIDENGSFISHYLQEDGSLEYEITLFSNQENAFINREINVNFRNLGFYDPSSDEELMVAVEETWNFDLTLSGSDSTNVYELDAVLGDSGATATQADISPISATIYYSFPYTEQTIEADSNSSSTTTTIYEEPPAFIGFRMKDGSEIRSFTGAGGGGYKNENYSTYYETIMYGKVIDVDEIESLLFVKSYPEESGTGETLLTDEYLYIVPLE